MENKTIYDIIVEDCTKGPCFSVSTATQKPNWEIPKYTKKEINAAGETVTNALAPVKGNVKFLEFQKALEILNNWRASHAYPLDVITSNLRKNNPQAIVVQRLKRLNSIVEKLERFPNMSVYSMQDLGGCRVIVDSIDEVYASVDRFRNSGIPHILKRENDYIKNPKESGYRGYHQVYQFQSDDSEMYNKGILIEIQVRTKLQHIWATAVEMMGIFTKSSLKSGAGDKDVLRFFVLISSLFAKREGMCVCPDTVDDDKVLISEIKEIDKRLNLISRLGALSTAIDCTDSLEDESNADYFLLMLDHLNKTLRIEEYTAKQIDSAISIYNQLEIENDNTDVDVVLVSASSFKELKEAYPNYFMDISKFVDIMKEILIL